jgi:DNA-binding response OmpR family regulator
MDYTDVNAYLITPETGARKIITDILLTVGFRHITPGSTYDDAKIAIDDNRADIIIIDAKFKDGDINELIKNVRNGRLGKNPFLPFLSFVSYPTKSLVREISDSGTDDLISYPMSTGQMSERMGILVEKRKPFVVTADYIGPDRRTTTERREGQQQIPLIEVPNTLRARVKKDVSPDEMEVAIRKALGEVHGQRVDRSIDQVAWLVTRILAGYSWAEGEALEPEIFVFLDKLDDMATELEFRLNGPEHQHIYHLCRPLLIVTAKLLKDQGNADPTNLKLLDLLSKAFKSAVNNEKDVDYTKQIQDLMAT